MKFRARFRSTVRVVRQTASMAALAAATFAQQPDLRAVSIDDTAILGNWQALTIAGTLDVLVENAGGADAGGAFDVFAYSDENANGMYDAGVDTILGLATLPDLLAFTPQLVSVPVSGPVHFREDLIYVQLDPADAIPESDEGNNGFDSGRACSYNAAPGPLSPVVEWAWNSSAVDPLSLNVMMTPAILDVSGDGVPDVVFGSTSSVGGGLVEVGILRALDGASGIELWSVIDPQLAINTAFNIAAGDLDNDGLPEIVASADTGTELICFENDGTFKWRSPTLENLEWGSASLADLDADGNPEIVVGRQVLDNNGNLLWTGTGGAANPQSGAMSIVCDFDLDGSPDIVTGNTVYTATGAILCQNLLLGDGYVAVANFDADPEPEIAWIYTSSIALLERDTADPSSLAIVWGPHVLNGGGGGPPTIADYDSDGLPEIAVAGASAFAVYEHDGALKWESTTFDSSSYVTGSSVFDFNGDGAAEAIYRDQLDLRVYEGATGNVLFQTAMSSCTWHEYAQVVDVDADGNAEIVVCANTNCGFGPQQGIYVFGSATDDWVPTRKIWNQYSYHITNVEDSGAIPLVENANWLFPSPAPFNNYRQNLLSTAQPAAAPDLTASWLSMTPLSAPDTATARIGNGGAFFVAAGLPVSFYDGDPNAGGILLGTAYTSAALPPGGFENVSLFLGGAPGSLFVVADDVGGLAGIVSECDELNNVFGVQLAPVAYCTGKLNSAGCVPQIGSVGMSSASAASGFVVQCTNVVNQKSGILFYRAPGARNAVPFQCGTLCVLSPVRRTPVQGSGGNVGPNDCSGSWSLDMNCFAAGACGLVVPAPELTVPGTQVNCQYWGRDAGTVPCNTQLSDALEYFVLL
jgi:hypothetical protein